MKIPVWFKDAKGNYHRIPPGLIETFADGYVVVSGYRKLQQISGTREFLVTALASGVFRYEINSDRLIYLASVYERSDP